MIYISTSAKPDDNEDDVGVTHNQFIPVNLSDDEYRAFVKKFFPTNAKANVVKQYDYYQYFQYIAGVQGVLTSIAKSLEAVCKNLPYTEVDVDQWFMTSGLGVFNNMMKQADAFFNQEEKVAKDRLRSIVQNMNKSFIINTGSKGVYFDFVGILSGHDNKGNIVSFSLGHEPSLDSSTKLATHFRTYSEQGSEIVGRCVEAMRLINEAIYGVDVAQHEIASRRFFVRKRVDTNFKQIVEHAFATANIPFPVPVFPEPYVHPVLKDAIGLLLIKPHDKNALYEKQRSASSQTPSTPEALQASINKEARYFYSGFELSLSIHIENKYASYIAQAADNEKPSLFALTTWMSMWFTSVFRPKGVKGWSGVNINNAPRYIIPPSKLEFVQKRRKELGYYSEEGRCNEDGIYLDVNGRLRWMPKSGADISDSAREYEKLLEEAYTLSYSVQAPLNMSRVGSEHPVYEVGNAEYKDKIGNAKKVVEKYAGRALGYSWDLDMLLFTRKGDATAIGGIRNSGSVKPTDLNIADAMRNPTGNDNLNTLAEFPWQKILPTYLHNIGKDHFATLSERLFYYYEALTTSGKAKSFPALLEEAEKHCRNVEGFDAINQLLYSGPTSPIIIGVDVAGTALPENLEGNSERSAGTMHFRNQNYVAQAYMALRYAVNDAAGSYTSKLAAFARKVGTDVEETPYFYPANGSLDQIVNLYSYVGGCLLYFVAKGIAEADTKTLLSLDYAYNETANYTGSSDELANLIVPFALILSKYAPTAKSIYESADHELDNTKFNENVTADTLAIPGLSEKSNKAFPHQIKTHGYLRNKPKYAVLDISAGGGKSWIGVTDAAQLVGEGLVKRPAVICPNGLVGNWCNEVNTFLDGKWNCIPITSDTYATWGEERLFNMISKAPKNTFVIIGHSFLYAIRSLDRFIVVGNAVARVNGAVEFLKKLGLDYILIDESHRFKRSELKKMPASKMHLAVRQLTSSSQVKFVRLGTGTFISNVFTDACGQSKFFNGQIFKSGDEFEMDNMGEVSVNGSNGSSSVVNTWLPGTATAIRNRLKKYSAVVTVRRKEWAFMLPRPIEKWIPVDLTKTPDQMEEDGDPLEAANLHKQGYMALLAETLEAIKHDKDINTMISKKSEEDAGATVDADSSEGSDDEEDEDDYDSSSSLEAALDPYIQRLERFLTDPINDTNADGTNTFGADLFKKAGLENYVTAPIRKARELIIKHLAPSSWSQGSIYDKYEFIEHEGKFYILAGEVQRGERYISHSEPGIDKNWIEQSQPKVIVLCRYTRTVDSMYRALPADIKKQAVRFHGEIADESGAKLDKWAEFEKFKTDPKCRILIANETGISEGHNLQCASVTIRLESPWAPGELDQSAARTFRPDTTKRFKRDFIFMYWIVSNNTIAVTKMGRLISKLVNKVKFDEAENSHYAEIQKWVLPVIKMSIDNIQDINDFAQLQEYYGAYGHIIDKQAEEFDEMKKKLPTQMLEVPTTPMFEGAKLIEWTPIVPGQKYPDPHGLGIIRFNEYVQNLENKDVQSILADPETLIGRYACTELGYGEIIGIRRKQNSKALSSVRVRLINGDTISVDASLLYLPMNVDKDKIRLFSKNAPKSTKKDIERGNNIEQTSSRRTGNAGASGKKPEPTIQAKPKKKLVVSLYPVVWNGMLAVEALAEDGEFDNSQKALLSKFGFDKFNPYIWVKTNNAQHFEQVTDYLDKYFTLPPKYWNNIIKFDESFHGGKGRKFGIELAPKTDILEFFKTRHKIVQSTNPKKPTLRPYPMVVNQSLVITIDMLTNPAAKKLLNKTIGSVKFEQADGAEYMFIKNKSEMIALVKHMESSGVEIENKEQLKSELEELLPLLKQRSK